MSVAAPGECVSPLLVESLRVFIHSHLHSVLGARLSVLFGCVDVACK